MEYVGEFYFSQAHSVCQTFCDSTSVCRGASVKNDIETANIRIAMWEVSQTDEEKEDEAEEEAEVRTKDNRNLGAGWTHLITLSSRVVV